ncbi:MAG: beta-carotene 15,15'-monooxygenase [Epsilonproteobacteria bacterium]|nr:beta-carotene 15,15'-monooxygenase [Campylobacterota bacterium]NPA64205.1 DUF4010 domain-containing protein [Campylobacterota bacterium]
MIDFIPSDLAHFLYVAILSFLVGLELKTYRYAVGDESAFHIGSTRTFAFIGIMGYLFYRIDIWFYILGYGGLVLIYLIYYYFKLLHDRASIISFLLISLVYAFGPLIEIFNIWMPTLLFVIIVFLLGADKSLGYLLERLNVEEFETLGKFLLLSAVILPLLPHTKLPYIDISAFEIWLVVVVVSTISYGSYIAQKYIFKNRGYLITALFGGLYSSTATTVVLAKKATSAHTQVIDSAIVLATSMMYVRLLALAFIFNKEIALHLALPLLGFAALGGLISLALYKRGAPTQAPIDDRNPLELGTAFLFALLFVAMIVITKYVSSHYGDLGIKVLSFIIGFTDIDPFVLSLLTGKMELSASLIVSAILIAAGSNNLLKALYALLFGRYVPKKAAAVLVVLGVLTIIAGIKTKGWI